MRLLLLTLAIFAGSADAAGAVTDKSKACYLLGRRDAMEQDKVKPGFLDQKKFQNAKKPFPSLTQCYKYNTEACCVSGHDKKIKDDYGGFLSDTCLREYQELEYYFCLGCHPKQHEWTTIYDTSGAGNCDPKKGDELCKYKEGTQCNGKQCIGHVRVCNSFAYRKLFPNCEGLTVTGDATATKKACTDTIGTGPQCCYDSDAKTCINGVPTTNDNNQCKKNGRADVANEGELFKAHSVYDNCAMSISSDWVPRLPSYWINETSEFLNQVKPPFFEDFYVEIVPDGSPDSTYKCFTNGGLRGRTISALSLLSTLFAIIMLIN